MAVEHILKVLPEAHEIQQASALSHVDEKVQVAFWPALAAGNGAKNPYIRGPVSIGERQDFLTPEPSRLIWTHKPFSGVCQ
jgi:hypothetical protein